MKKQEAHFQTAVVRLLRLNGFFVFSVPNGGSRHAREAHNLKLQGLMAGVADLVILLPGGQAVFAELKSPDGSGRQSPAQRAFAASVRCLGFDYQLWDSWPAIEKFLHQHRRAIAAWRAQENKQ